MKLLTYAAPVCEYDTLTVPGPLLTGSDLTDDGAGDFLVSGEEYEF